MTNSKPVQDRRSIFFFCSPLPKLCIYFFITFITLLLLLQIQSIKSSLSFSSSWFFFTSSNTCNLKLNQTRFELQSTVAFFPLKNRSFDMDPVPGRTWFMSSVDDIREPGEARHLFLPSNDGRLLCLAGNHISDGAKNSYSLAWSDALPLGARLLPGLTFVSDSYYDYTNLWHALSTVTPVAGWSRLRDCTAPDRWVLFHWGELRKIVAPWIQTLMEATLGRRAEIERLDYAGPTCFEKAVVFRHGEGGMSKETKAEVYDMLRCRARAYCNIGNGGGEEEKEKVVRVTVFFRIGSRAFKNETAVVGVAGEQCQQVGGCRLRVAWSSNLSFCEQVKLMSETDVLVSPHGAQMTNMIFMDKNSSVMEFLPKGWLELAGAGQYVFRWLAEWSGMRHQGTWWDPVGEPCPYGDDKDECFTFYKDGQIGLDEGFFAKWLSEVLSKAEEYKSSAGSGKPARVGSSVCPCR